jgi:hypoxanthine-guanine phosphoribosyltransferase
MRRDFDYVTMADYDRDLTEQSELAASIIAGKTEEIRDMKLMLIAAVLSNGGSLEVHDGCLADARDKTLECWYDQANRKRVFRVA